MPTEPAPKAEAGQGSPQASERTSFEVAAEPGLRVLRAPEMQGAGPGYPLEFAPGISGAAGARLLAWGLRAGPLALVSEAHLLELHGEALLASLRAAGFAPRPCLVAGGEGCKTLAGAEALYAELAAAGVDRSGCVVAFGGGVVGDLAGFAAATWMRGVPFVQVPTSLLAMVDSSVGGKTGVDLPYGKNLVGAFKQPEGVLIDPALLATLPELELRAGLGELVKHALLDEPALFAELEAAPASFLDAQSPGWTDRLVRAVEVKLRVVAEDPFERGRRATLNLGHTFAHAFELCSGYALRHGLAVATGLLAAARLGVALGRTAPELAERLAACLDALGLPTELPDIDPRAARAAMGLDKKKRGRTLRFVIPTALGAAALVDDPGEPVDAALASVLAG